MYNVELSLLENSGIVHRIYTYLQILEGPVHGFWISQGICFSSTALFVMNLFFITLFSYCLISSILQGLVFSPLFLFDIASVYFHVPTAHTHLFQVLHLDLWLFVHFVVLFLLLSAWHHFLPPTPKLNLICYSNLSCLVLCFFFLSPFPPHLWYIFDYLPHSTSSYPRILS